MLFVMCSDCHTRYKQNNRYGPKFLICTCNKEPRELDIEMAKSEIEQQIRKPGITEYKDNNIIESKVTVWDKGSDKTEVSNMSAKRRRSVPTRQ